ncbi:hypothetical protein PVAND_004318 [Polypedilum vanderplanki]|uniref:Uncharacterized protein n=1 Tax=Polypedilum vanderplanki TaxID=319348 RepID=A0A9J6BWS4_POLVA|nr:hypothetical protein PVAND_004318 [Polypedilum vanderplanki]
MGLLSVEKFLCCFPLETGGYVCGFFSAISSGIALIGNLFIFFSGIFSTQTAGWWTILILNTIFLCILCYASVRLIYGTKNSNPDQMKLYLIFSLVSVIFAFIQIILNSGWGTIVGAIIWALIVLYFFVFIQFVIVKELRIIEMWTVKKFLCCFKLSTGGYVLSILNGVSNFISSIILAFALCFAIFNYQKFIDTIQEITVDLSSFWKIFESQMALIITLTVVFVLTSYSFYASILLYQGTKNKNAQKLKPFMRILAVGTIVAFFHLLQFDLNAVMSVALNTIINVYLFVCIYSFYLQIKKENELIFNIPTKKDAIQKSLP